MRTTRHQRQAFGRLLRKLGSAAMIIRAADAPSSLRSRLGRVLLRKIPEEPQRQMLPLKHVRLQQLYEAGLNCPPFRFWLRGELNPEELQEFLRMHGRISLRNFTEERILDPTPELPVAYDRSDWNFILDFCRRYNRQYHTLVNEALPLSDSLLAGNVIVLDAERYMVAYFEGYGTPRDVSAKVSSELKVYLRPFDAPAPQGVPQQIEEIVAKVRAFRPDFRPITFEFSIYPRPVGLRGTPEIFWEWRSGSAHDLYAVISRLMERVDAHELTFQLSALDQVLR